VKYIQCVKICSFDVLVLFLKCAVFEALCYVSDGHYIESSNYSVSGEAKGRRAIWGVRLPFT
jgi:hypothetical protein